MQVLIIEAGLGASKSTESLFRREGFHVFKVMINSDVINLAKRYKYDVIVLNVQMMDGICQNTISQLRRAKVATPLIIITADRGVLDRVAALRQGADDCLIIPYHDEELLARIQAIIRRSRGYSHSIIKSDDLSINLGTKTAQLAERSLSLTLREYQILEALFLRKGQVLTKDMFFNHIYGGRDEPDYKIIDVLICKLRKKLKQASGGKDYIMTVWGRGYCLTPASVMQVTAAA